MKPKSHKLEKYSRLWRPVFSLPATTLTGILITLLFLFTGPAFIMGKIDKTWTWKYPPERITVTEDLSFIYQWDPQSEITIIEVMSRGGKSSAPLDKRGTALLATRLTVEMPDTEKLRQLMHLGSTMMYHVEGDYSTVTIRSLSENLEDTLKIVTGVLKAPLYSGIRIDNIKRYMEHMQNRQDDSPDQMAVQTCLNAFFRDFENGYAASVYGSEKSRKEIKRRDVQDFYNRYFSVSNLEIVVTSNLDRLKLSGFIKAYFQGFPATIPGGKSSRTHPPCIGKIPEKKRYTIEKDKKQVLLSFGILLPGANEKNYTMGYMLDNLLGKGIGCKLWPLREKKELAYSLNTGFTQMKDAGLLTVTLKTDPGKQEDAYRQLKALLARVYKYGVSEEDVKITRVRAAADFLRSNETKIRRVQTLAYFEALGLGYDFIGGFLRQLESVTPAELNGYIKETLAPEKMVEVIIGPGQPGNPALSRQEEQ